MPETTRNHNRVYTNRPRYGARRLGALMFAGFTLFGAGKIAEGAINNIKGEPAPVLHENDPNTEVVTVQAGDTAWDISEAHTPDSKDNRPLVDAILSQHDALDGLQPGDKIVVPAYHDEEKSSQE